MCLVISVSAKVRASVGQAFPGHCCGVSHEVGLLDKTTTPVWALIGYQQNKGTRRAKEDGTEADLWGAQEISKMQPPPPPRQGPTNPLNFIGPGVAVFQDEPHGRRPKTAPSTFPGQEN